MSDIFDMIIASDITAWRTRGDIRMEGVRQRAKNIEDNFGIRPQDYEEYRSQHGGTGLLKALAYTAGGLAIGALIGSGAALIGLAVGGMIGMFSAARQGEKVRSGYSDYLDSVAAQGRTSKSAGIDLSYTNGAGRTRTFTADLETSRQQGLPATKTL